MGDYTLFIKNLVTDVMIGIHPHEKKQLQPVRIQLSIDVTTPPDNLNDDINHVLSYSILRKQVMSLCAAQHYNLVETLAIELTKKMLALPHAIRCTTTVEKLNVYDNVESVGFTVTQERK